MASAVERRQIYQDFTGGLNTRLSPIKLALNQFSVLNNAVVNNQSILEKINGFTVYGSPFPNDPDSFIRLLINYRKGTAVDQLIMAAQDNNNANATYKVDFKETPGDGTFHYIGHTIGTATFTTTSTAVVGIGTTWTTRLKVGDKIKATADADAFYVEILSVNNDLSLTLSSPYAGAGGAGAPYIARIMWNKNTVPRATVFDNKAIFTNGSETMATYDSATVNLISDPDAPKAKYIENHKNRVFAACTSAGPSRVYWSNVNNEQLWEGDSEEDVYPQDNGSIVAIKSFADSLVVFKNSGSNNAIYQIVGSFDQDVVGTPDFIRRIDGTENIGIVSERSPIVHNGFLYFITETGLYSIDQRMSVRKVTYDIDSLINGFNFSLGPQLSKTYAFDTSAQWNSGTLDGTKVTGTGNGVMGNYADYFSVSNALQKLGCASVAIDSTNNLHLAYVDSTNHSLIHYQMYLPDTTLSRDETSVISAAAVGSLSMDVAPSGKVGIIWRYQLPATAGYELHIVERSPDPSGTWGTDTVIANGYGANSFKSAQWGLSLKYNASSFPRVAASQRSVGVSPTNVGLIFYYNNGGPWIGVGIDNNDPYYGISMSLDSSDNPSITAYRYGISLPKGLACFTSSNGGLSFTLLDSLALPSSSTWKTDAIEVSTESTGTVISGYQAGDGSIAKRNHTTATSSTLESNATVPKMKGFTTFFDPTLPVPADQIYVYYSSGASLLEKYIFENSSTLQGSGVTTTVNIATGDKTLTNNGRVFASITYGASTNQLVARRISFRSIWTGPEQSDLTLTSWGTYDISGESSNGATITHKIALSNAPGPTVFNTITNGQIISTDPSQIYIINKITSVLTDFVAPTINSVVNNYIGAGVDSKQIVGVSYRNELYYSGSPTGATFNDKTLLLDKFGAFLTNDYPASCFETYKSRLFAGRSSNGDLLTLLQGLDFGGSPYNLELQSKEDFLESIEMEKSIHKIYVLFKVQPTGTFTFSYRLNPFADPTSPWIDTVVDQTSGGVVPGFQDILVGSPARSIQCRVQSADLDVQLGLVSFVIVYGDTNLR